MAFHLPPAPGKFIDTGTVRVHYETQGPEDAPPLVLVHGLLSSTYAWQQSRERLAENRRLYMIDLPGHGYSDRSDDFSMSLLDQASVVCKWIDSLELESFDLLGQSMGGAVALLVAAQKQEQLRKFVIVDSVCYPFEMPLKGKLGVIPVLGGILVRHVYRRPLLAAFLRNDVYFDPSCATDEEIDTMYAHFRSPASRRAIHRAMLAVDQPEWLGSYIRQVETPTLVLWGENDALFPVELGTRLANDLPNAELKTFPECGHAMMIEKPDRFCDEVIGFLG